MQRISWSTVPDFVQKRLADQMGGRVVATRLADGGFSPSFAGRADLDDGRQVFIKAVSSAQNPDTPDLVRRELQAVDALCESVATPVLLAKVDERGWVAGAFEYVEGTMPALPWDLKDLGVALAALAHLNELSAPASLPPARRLLEPLFNGWRQLRARGGFDDSWAQSHIDKLVTLEIAALETLEGHRLIHNDVRADNMLITGDNQVVFVDWAHACSGPAWLDLVLSLAPIQLEGGGTPDDVLARVSYLDVPDDTLTSVHAAACGYFLYRGSLPDPPGLPTVRAFQRAQGKVALGWLKRLLA